MDSEIQKQKSYKKHYENKKAELMEKIKQVSERAEQAKSDYEVGINISLRSACVTFLMAS